eukprot:10213_1
MMRDRATVSQHCHFNKMLHFIKQLTSFSMFVAHVISIAIHLTESPGNQIIPPEKDVVKEVVPRLSMFAQEETSFDVQESEIGVEQPESEIVRVTSLTSGIYIADGGVAYCIAHYIEKDAHYIEKEAMNTINIIGKNLSTQPPFENGQVIIDGAERLRVHDSRTNYGALRELSELEQLYEVPNGRAIINGALRDLFAYYYVKEEATAHTSNNDSEAGFYIINTSEAHRLTRCARSHQPPQTHSMVIILLSCGYSQENKDEFAPQSNPDDVFSHHTELDFCSDRYEKRLAILDTLSELELEQKFELPNGQVQSKQHWIFTIWSIESRSEVYMKNMIKL